MAITMLTAYGFDERKDYLRDVGGPLRTAITKLKNALDELDKKT